MRARLTIVLLALFVAFDVVLVTLAVRHTSTIPAAEAGPISAPPSDATLPSASPSRSIAAKPSAPTSSAPAIPPNEPVFLAVGVDGAVLRATRGDCEASRQPAVSVSTNRGGVFRDRRSTALPRCCGSRSSATVPSRSSVGTRRAPSNNGPATTPVGPGPRRTAPRRAGTSPRTRGRASCSRRPAARRHRARPRASRRSAPTSYACCALTDRCWARRTAARPG